MTAAISSGPDEQQPQRVYVGILATDPMRCIGLQAIFEDNLGFRTVLLTEGRLPKQGRPRLVVMDAGLQSGDELGLAVEQLRRLFPSAPVIVVARGDGRSVLEPAVSAGAVGLVEETASIEEIRACVQTVMKGASCLPERRPEALPDGSAVHQANLASRFTPKEREVLRWLTQGRSNREIAATMHIDEATVKAHLGRMLRKAKATNRVELTLRVLAQQS